MTVEIKDLPDGKPLDSQAMEMVRGGFSSFVVTGALPVVNSSKAEFHDFQFTHTIDKASPIL